jgi:ABC-type uncharacterized transport system auxiliary subunit
MTPSAVRRVVLAAASLVAAGCIQVGPDAPAVPERFHVVEGVDAGGAPSEAAPQTAPGPTLAVRGIDAPSRFGRQVLRRRSGGIVVPDPGELWADEPHESVTEAVREALARSGAFASVADASDVRDTALVLSGQLLDFTVDESGAKPSARASLRLALVDGPTGAVVRTGAWSASEPLGAGDGGPAIGAAMGRALSRVLRDALADWRRSGALAPR